MVRQGLLQPHANLVDQALCTAKDSDTNLFRLQPPGRLRLVSANQQFSRQTAQRFPHCDWTHTPATLTEGYEARPS